MIENDNYRIKHLYTSMMVIEKLTVMTIIKESNTQEIEYNPVFLWRIFRNKIGDIDKKHFLW